MARAMGRKAAAASFGARGAGEGAGQGAPCPEAGYGLSDAGFVCGGGGVTGNLEIFAIGLILVIWLTLRFQCVCFEID